MRVSSRPKLSEAFSLAILLLLVSAFSLYGFVGSTNSAYAATTATHVTRATTSFKGTLGNVQFVGTTSPASLPKASGSVKYRVVPMRGRPASGGASATVASRPDTISTSVTTGSLLHNFNGVDEIANLAASATPLEPPDEGLGANNGYVFNIVNVTGAIYRPNGAVAVAPFFINPFFKEAPAAFLSDPRTYYDKATNTWFATVLEANFTTNNESHFDVAVNASGNPTTPWTVYKFDTTDPTGAGCPCFGDYPIFGIDQYNIYVSSQEFPIVGNGYNGAEIYAISKSQLETYAKSVNFVRFGSLSVAGVIGYHIQPAYEHTGANAEYFMSALDPNNTFDNRLSVWAMTNRDNVAQGVIPNLSATVIHSEAYAMPVNAQTPPGVCPCSGVSNSPLPTTGIVQSDFDALEEVQFLNGHLYTSLNTSVNIAGDSAARDGIAWFDVTPALSGGVISSTSKVVAQGYIASRGLYLMYPHTEHTFNGNTVVVFTFGGPGTYLSAGYTVMSSGAKNFGGIRLAAAGVTTDNGFTGTKPLGGAGRWGDYSAGQLDPSGNGVWLATQYIPNNGDQLANWGNRVFEVAA